MSKLTFQLMALTVIGRVLLAQPANAIDEHIMWERDFPELAVSVVSTAAVDGDGRLWAISDYRWANRLLCIAPDGKMLINAELPKEVQPGGPVDFRLAITPSGTIVLTVRHSHAVGRAIYSDGAAFAVLNPDGTLGPVKKVAGRGPEYKLFIATNDSQFLLVGDQSPMVVLRLRVDGELAWRRTFPSDWVLPSAAPLEDGGACIASPDYRRPIVHMIWIDAQGAVRHQGQIAGNRSHVVSANGFCTVLFDHESARESTFHLTSFDSKFARVWTTPVLANAPPGSVYGMIAVADGYIVTSAIRDGLFVGKYAFSGHELWRVTDATRKYADHIVSAGDGFYLLGAGPKDRDGLHVVRMK